MREIMTILAGKYSEFCSEADFQFALAWEIKKYFTEKAVDAEVRLECLAEVRLKKANKPERRYIDIIVRLNGELFPIELKYKLKEQGRVTDNPPDMVKDIERLEKLQSCDLKVHGFSESHIKTGFAIWLTDHEGYIDKEKSKAKPTVHNYYIWDGEPITGSYSYHDGKKKGKEKHKARIDNKYLIKWEKYENGKDKKTLWYALISIPPVAK